jgi:hypothetical protein
MKAKKVPTYNTINKKTKKQKEMFCSISEMEIWLKANPAWDVLCGTPLIHPGFRKTPHGFRDVLKQIKKNHPRSSIKV